MKMPSLTAPSLPSARALSLPSLPSFTLTRGRGKESSLVGLEIESGSIGAAEVRSNGSVHVNAVATAALPPESFHDGEVADPESVTEAIRELFAQNKLGKRVRLGIANQR